MGFFDCIFNRKDVKEMISVLKKREQFSKSLLGLHINPVLMGNGYEVTENDIKNISKTFSYVVSNFWPQWWNDLSKRYKMINLMIWCAKYNLKLIIRVDDPSITEDWSDEKSKEKLNPEWFFTKHLPYIFSILEEVHNVKTEYKNSKYMLQLLNEPWVDGATIQAEFGNITPELYINYLKEVTKQIRMKDKDIDILSCAITTFVEKKYYGVLNELLDRGLLKLVNGLSLHWYDHIKIDIKHFKRLKKIANRVKYFPVYITETNSINPENDDRKKFKTIKNIYKLCNKCFSSLESFCVFCYNEDSPLKEWAFRDKGLQRMIENDAR